MNIMLGNISFNQVEDKLGYLLNDNDKLLWDEFYSNSAKLSDKKSGFHVFDIPRCILFSGEEAKNAILKMFTKDKIVKQKGTFEVLEIENT